MNASLFRNKHKTTALWRSCQVLFRSLLDREARDFLVLAATIGIAKIEQYCSEQLNM
jgi:hypothetical protein